MATSEDEIGQRGNSDFPDTRPIQPSRYPSSHSSASEAGQTTTTDSLSVDSERESLASGAFRACNGSSRQSDIRRSNGSLRSPVLDQTRDSVLVSHWNCTWRVLSSRRREATNDRPSPEELGGVHDGIMSLTVV